MTSLPSVANNNLTQIFFALLPEMGTGQNVGRKEKLSEIQDLLKLGIDVNIEILPGITPLCKVIEGGGSKSLVELLLHYGADVEVQANPDFCWIDPDGKKITNQVYALARQRSIKCQDKESLDIQQLIQRQLMQKHMAQMNDNSSNMPYSHHDKVFETREESQFSSNQESNFTLPHRDALTRKKLYVFDFDNTLVNEHFHNVLKGMGVAQGRASEDLVEFLLSKYGVKNREAIIKIFQSILKNRDCIAIASGTRYPETVYATLNSLNLSLDENEIFYLASNINTELDLTIGKNIDILTAMVHFEIIDVNAVYLISADHTALQIAKTKLNLPDSNLILVEREANATQYLNKIQRLIKGTQFNEEPSIRPPIQNLQMRNQEPTLINEDELIADEKESYEKIENAEKLEPSARVSVSKYMPYINFNSMQVPFLNQNSK